MDPKESFPAGIPHPSPSPPGNHGDGKLGVGEAPEQRGTLRSIPGYGVLIAGLGLRPLLKPWTLLQGIISVLLN
jgi:hypothetical protein